MKTTLLVIIFSMLVIRVFGSLNSSLATVDVPLCHPEDSSAILLFEATFSDTPPPTSFYCSPNSTTDTSSWNASQDCCEWEGINCDEETGHVVSLSLQCVRLRGAITSNSSLFSLAHLESLVLYSNDVRGSPILPEFGRFKNLTELSLFNCNFNGSVPLEIAHLTKLVSFSLGQFRDDVTISIGTGTFKALAQNATELRELDFYKVDMSTVSLASFTNLSSSLTSMTLGQCELNGEFPETAFHFPKLQSLDLQFNNLHGTFPWSSINLESLSYLDLSFNNFTGQLPQIHSNFSRKVSTKYLQRGIPSALTQLILDGNSFNGEIPSWIYELPSLRDVYLDSNQFTGELNEFRTTSLLYFSVAGNKLHGQIPKSIFQNVNLTDLDISSNNFTGNFEIENLSKFKELSFLSMSWTNLSLSFNNSINHTFEILQNLHLSSCNIREFPNFLKSSKQLNVLDLSNNQMQGSFPKWFEEVGKDSLYYLNISHNFLTSSFIDTNHWPYLQYFDISSNLFSGSLPISNSSLFKFFLASNNKFSGPIPTSICKFKSLQLLDLSNNNLSNGIPQCMGNFSDVLLVFDLRNNKLQGVIPANFSRARSLRSLNLNGNQLEGSFPGSLAYCKGLEVIDLGNNLLNDTLPNWLEALPELRVLVLRANMFHGPIGIPKISKPFPELRIIDLSNNDFIGTLPIKFIENFKTMINGENVKMKYMGNRYYQDSIVVNMKGNEIVMVKVLTIFTTIDLSNNHFTGEIPVFLGELKSLKNLNLSRNMIGGSIPSSLGKLSNLEGLDLSCNELVGKIPNELVDMNWLSFLNLSYNHLEGSIPHGKQFDTFNNNSYIGNLGLCGFPMSESCDNNKVQHDQGGDGETQNGITLDWKVVMTGYASGVVIGASIGYMVLFSRTFDRWSMKKFGIQLRRSSFHPTGRRRKRNQQV